MRRVPTLFSRQTVGNVQFSVDFEGFPGLVIDLSSLVPIAGEFIRNLVSLESGGSGGVVWRIRADETRLVCAVGSRNGTEETKLLVLDFDVDAK